MLPSAKQGRPEAWFSRTATSEPGSSKDSIFEIHADPVWNCVWGNGGKPGSFAFVIVILPHQVLPSGCKSDQHRPFVQGQCARGLYFADVHRGFIRQRVCCSHRSRRTTMLRNFALWTIVAAVGLTTLNGGTPDPGRIKAQKVVSELKAAHPEITSLELESSIRA